ncbi:MAG: hypothetical protein AAF191_19270, partial [Verrucomicrobiota bacterium]
IIEKKGQPVQKDTRLLLAMNTAQRFGGGSIFFQKGKTYLLDLIGLHVPTDPAVGLSWSLPGTDLNRLVPFAPKNMHVPEENPSDLDDDGIPDHWELVSTGHTEFGPFHDGDRDGVPLVEEWLAGGDPLASDTDGDGSEDLPEAAFPGALVDGTWQPEVGPGEGWKWGWVEPDVRPAESKEFPKKPVRLPVLRHPEESGHVLLADRSTLRGNRGGWTPYHYRTLSGDFDVRVKVSFPVISPDRAVFRGCAGGLMARQTVGSESPFEVSFSYGNLGELLRKEVPLKPTPELDGIYEVTFGGNVTWQDQTAWIRLVRIKQKIHCLWSPDGEVWIQSGKPVSSATGPLLVGTFALGAGVGMGPLAVHFAEPIFEDPRHFQHLPINQTAVSWRSTERGSGGLSEVEQRRFGIDQKEGEKLQWAFQTVEELTTEDRHVTSGTWRSAGGRGVYAQHGEGTLTYPFSLPEPGLYRGVLITGPGMNYGGTGNLHFPLQISVNGHFLETLQVIPRDDGMSEFPMVFPALPAGDHQLSIAYFSPRPGRSIPIKGIRLEKMEAAAEEEVSKGILFFKKTETVSVPLDLVEKLAAGRNQFPKAEISSAVSPACVEGKGAFPAWILAEVDGKEWPVQAGVGSGWFANIPLSESGPTNVGWKAENGLVRAESSMTWAETDVASGGDIVIRKGDALRLGISKGGEAELKVGPVVMGTVSPGKPFAYRFEEAGSFPVRVVEPDGG